MINKANFAIVRIVIVMLLCSVILACGQTGKLYLPEQKPAKGKTAIQFW